MKDEGRREGRKKEGRMDGWMREGGTEGMKEERKKREVHTEKVEKRGRVASYANTNVRPLPWSVEFHQHGLVLRCQVVEVRVPELEHVSARGHGGGKTRQQRERDGGKEAGSGRHVGRKRVMILDGKRTKYEESVTAADRSRPSRPSVHHSRFTPHNSPFPVMDSKIKSLSMREGERFKVQECNKKYVFKGITSS